MQTNSAAIVTSTSYKNWYPGKIGPEFEVDKIRGDLALETISKSKELGFQVIVIDKASSKAFRKELKKLKVKKLETDFSGTFSAARRRGYIVASKLPKVSVIIWVEPEKTSFITKSLTKACKIIYDGAADIVIPARGNAAFSSLPPFQKKSEQLGNHLIQKIMGEYFGHKFPYFDIFFGPKIFANRPEILSLFLTKYTYRKFAEENDITPIESWSNALIFPVISAIIKGYKVVSFEVPYHHPLIQTQIETGSLKFNQKRILQRRSIVKGVRELLHFYQDPNNSILSISRVSPSGETG